MYGSLLWVCGLMSIMSFSTERVHARKHVKHTITTLMLAGLGPSLPLAYLGSCYMLNHRTKGVLPAFRSVLRIVCSAGFWGCLLSVRRLPQGPPSQRHLACMDGLDQMAGPCILCCC
jgi:hypothetical protein